MRFLALPTWRGSLFLFFTAVAMAVVYVNSGLLTAFTAALLAAIALSAFIMAQLSFAGIVFSRNILQDGSCGKPLYLELSLQNRFPLFRQSCIVTEDFPFVLTGQKAFVIPPLAPGEHFTASWQITAEKRGVFNLKKVYLSSGDPLGFFYRKKRFILPAQVEIHPRLLIPETFPVLNSDGGMQDTEGRNTGRAGKGIEFFGVRPYRQGDEIRHIHWKSTAAKGCLMVKEFESSAVDQIVILLDTEKKKISGAPVDNNFEFLVSCAGSIAECVSRKYCFLQFSAAGTNGELLHFSGDAASIRKRIRHTLLFLQGTEFDFATVLKSAAGKIPSGSIVCILSMSTQEIPDCISILEEQNCRCFWIYAPPENFPVTEPDKPRIINRKKVRDSLAGLSVLPEIADFTTGPEILENWSRYEKL